jgi:hypothetical protein
LATREQGNPVKNPVVPDLKQAARSTGITLAETRDAESVLGRSHRLTRALTSTHTLALQTVVAALAVVAACLGLILHLGPTMLVVAVCTLVALAFLLAWMAARRRARERARDLIAAGRDGVALSVVARERRRLASPKERERFAKSLEAFHRDAMRWYEIPPQFRPPHGILQLRDVNRELAALTEALRRDRVRVQGVALTEKLLTDGCESPLFADELGPLREELNRIRYLLATPNRSANDDEARRLAA